MVSFEVLCAVVTLTLWLLYWYSTKTFDHWKQKGVHYREPIIFFGNIKDRLLFRTSFHELQMNLYKNFEGHKFAGYFEGRRPTLMLRDPELIKHVMVRDFEHFVDRPTMRSRTPAYIQNMLLNLKGQQWKSVRALMTPAFSSGKLRAMEHLVDQCGMQMSAFLQSLTSGEGKEEGSTILEMKEFFGRFTLDVIATCAFGVQCDSLKDEEAEFVKIAARFNDISVPYRVFIFAILMFVPQLARFIPINFMNKKVMEFLVDVVRKTKEHRRVNKEQKWNDFLQLMIDAAEEEEASDKDSSENKTNNPVMDEDTIIAQSILFLLAGFETSSTLLTYASYELALNRDIQDKLRIEVKQVLDKHGACSYEALQEMTYLEMVLLEALRKHPPVARVDRMCTQPYTIPGTSVQLEKDSMVSIPIMGLHHDQQYYPQPELFDPDRFKPEVKASRSPYVFLPFGSGPRNCIGMRFALMSTKLGMAHLVKDFYLEPCNKTDVPYQFSRYSMFLKAQNGIWLKLSKI